MNVFTAILPLLLAVGTTIANPTFRLDEGVLDQRCPLAENPMSPVHLPHSRDCNKFLKCFNGRAYTLDCPPGQEFGLRIQRCDYPVFAQCRAVLAEPQPAGFSFDDGLIDPRCPLNDDPMRPAHVPHRTSCNKFMKCFAGKSFELECPPGQEWAVALNRCDFPSIARCSIPMHYQAQQQQEPELSEATVLESEQPESVEALPMKAEFVYSSGVPDIRCPRSDDPFHPIHIPHVTDCNKFQKCFDGRAYVLNCPPGQEFGARINRCDFPQFAQCQLPKRKNLAAKKANKWDDEYYDYYYDDDDFPLASSEWTDDQREMIAGISDIRCPRSDDDDNPVHLTHPKDCGKFYKCYNGRAFLILCPAGQHWSTRFDRCDYPKVAKCTIRP